MQEPGRLCVRDAAVAQKRNAFASTTRSSSCRIETTTSRASSIRESASFGIMFYDYASPITEPIEKRWISRHRLQKKDPSAAVSEPVKPIVYYVDNGAPEPIRTALVEGASWWNAAFEAAGFRNAFQVKVLPETPTRWTFATT